MVARSPEGGKVPAAARYVPGMIHGFWCIDAAACATMRRVHFDGAQRRSGALVLTPWSEEGILQALAEREGFWFDSACDGPRADRAFFGVAPRATFVIGPDGRAFYSEGGRHVRVQGDPLRFVSDRIAATRVRALSGDEPFPSGWAGYVAYDLGLVLDRVRRAPRRAAPEPLMYMAYYERVQRVRPEVLWTTGGLPAVRAPLLAYRGVSMDKDSYAHAVAKVRRHIADGDVYLANIAQQLFFDVQASDAEIYRRLRRVHPGGMGGLYRGPGWAILCTSPEVFLLGTPDGRLETRPIKGTRPRGCTAAEDDRLRDELFASEKEQAELTMVVDMERNDLSRLLQNGSVRVKELPHVESLSHVHHLVASVEAEGAHVRFEDILRALFPGGSVTGAPKLRAMEIIDALEPVRRGAYTGALGFISDAGHLAFNILIRSLVRVGRRARLGVGSGISYDSDPEDEYRETWEKARGILEAVGLSGVCEAHVRHG